MKAITICQPWAWAIVEGYKHVENRTWPTKHRGRLLIHAGKSTRWWRNGCESLLAHGIEPPEKENVQWGSIIGFAQLVDCLLIESETIGLDNSEAAEIPFAYGPHCWILHDAQRFESPIAYCGKQGLFEVHAGRDGIPLYPSLE